MSTASRILLDYVCPTMGGIIAVSMFAAPVKALQIALQRGSLQELNPTPWIFMTGNCVGWVGYAFLIHDYFVLIPNGIGTFISLWLNFGAAKLQYMEKFMMHRQIIAESESESLQIDMDHEDGAEPKLISAENQTIPIYINLRNTRGIASATQDSKVILILMLWLLIFSSLKFFAVAPEHQKLVVGIVVNIILVAFFGAPLSTIFTVIQTRNSSSIHFWTMVLNIWNTSFWLMYGLSIMDPYICVPNGLGLLLGLAQGMLCMTFPRVAYEEEEFSPSDSGGGLGEILMKEDGFQSRKQGAEWEYGHQADEKRMSTKIV